MINEIKKKHLIIRIVISVLCWCISGYLIYISMDSIKSYFMKPINFNELKVEDIKEGVRVRGQVSTVFDYYSYMTEDGKTVSMEFFVPVGEKQFMGLECDGKEMDTLKDNIDIFWNSMNSENESDSSVGEQLGVVEINGTIVKLKGESLEFFERYINELDWSEEDKQDFIPYVVKDGEYDGLNTSNLVLLGLTAIVILFIGLYSLFCGITGRNLKDIYKYCEKQPDKETALKRIDQFYSMGTPVQGIVVNDNYFMSVQGLRVKVNFIETENIVWAYQYVVQHRYNFVPVGKSYAIILRLANGKQKLIDMKNAKASQEAIEYLAKSIPYIYFGYNDDLLAMYNSNKDEMVNTVRQRRQEIVADFKDFQYQE